MMLLFKKKKFSLVCFIIPKNATFFLHLFSSASATQNPSPKSNFITNYLITSCGLSPQKAATASKPIANVTSASGPDSVRHFFKHHGFIDTQISTLIINFPRILCADVDKTLQPNFQSLYKYCIPEHKLRKLIVSNPLLLTSPSAIPRLEFWKRLLNGDKEKLISAFTKNRGLINRDTDNVVPKISLLKDYGFSETDITWIVVRSTLILRTTASMEALLKKTQELGFQLGSKMFLHGLLVVGDLGDDVFMARMKVCKSFGWSQEEFLTALRKFPYLVLLVEENMRKKMEFLVGTAGCTQSYIVSRPMILSYSLERRLIPRHHVMKILKSNKLIDRDMDFYAIVAISEKKFMDRFILRYKDKAPALLENYNAACAREIPP